MPLFATVNCDMGEVSVACPDLALKTDIEVRVIPCTKW